MNFSLMRTEIVHNLHETRQYTRMHKSSVFDISFYPFDVYDYILK